MSTRRPFDDLADLLRQMPSGDSAAVASLSELFPARAATPRHDLSQMLEWLGAWQRTRSPKLAESHICLFVSSYAGSPLQTSPTDFIEHASKGQAPVGKLCKERGVGLRVLEMAVAMPHVVSSSWPEKECMAAAAFGMEATASGGDILGLAAMAPGDDQYCYQLCQILIDDFINVSHDVSGSSSDNTLALKILDLMRAKTGRDVAAMVGAMIAARNCSLPVLVESWSGLTALTILSSIDRSYVDHIKIASVENDTQASVARSLGMAPVLGMPVNLGVGCGVALALSAVAPLLNLVE